jgi:triphosphoribosyl-dephospho-CoA synthase
MTILSTIRSTREAVRTNTNLGIALLICPLALAAKWHGQTTPQTVSSILRSLDAADCKSVYEAIRIAKPGGLGVCHAMDVSKDEPDDLIAAMTLAADRDLVAKQYTNGFREVFHDVVPLLIRGSQQFHDMRQAIVYAHVELIARYGDSLIARKCGVQTSNQAKFLASKSINGLQSGQLDDYYSAISDLDFWLRSDGHRRNPGTTADMITAGLFVGLASGKFKLSGKL